MLNNDSADRTEAWRDLHRCIEKQFDYLVGSFGDEIGPLTESRPKLCIDEIIRLALIEQSGHSYMWRMAEDDTDEPMALNHGMVTNGRRQRVSKRLESVKELREEPLRWHRGELTIFNTTEVTEWTAPDDADRPRQPQDEVIEFTPTSAGVFIKVMSKSSKTSLQGVQWTDPVFGRNCDTSELTVPNRAAMDQLSGLLPCLRNDRRRLRAHDLFANRQSSKSFARACSNVTVGIPDAISRSTQENLRHGARKIPGLKFDNRGYFDLDQWCHLMRTNNRMRFAHSR